MIKLTRAAIGLQFASLLLVLATLTHAQTFPKKISSGASSGNKCALIIPTGGRDTCVSTEAVNRAFNLAAEEFRLPKTSSPDDLDNDELGNVIVETTRIIAEEFKLPRDAIHAGLPLIDTRKTVIERACPSRVKRPKCSVNRYRELNGLCNNLEHAHWGAVNAPFRRLVPAAYADGVSLPRISVTGDQLPTARFVSTFVHRDLGFHDHAVTVFLPAFGQLIDHDMALGAETKDPKTGAEPKCCDVAPERRHPACWPIDIPADDPFFSLFRRRCLEFVRSATGLNEFCKLGARSTFNSVTSFIDANFVYGTDKKAAAKLRTFRGGLLKTNPVHARLGLKDLLPAKLDNPDEGCLRPNRDVHCFVAGDGRVNQQMMLVALHTLFMREHNRIATELSKINPHWDDETLYQETRHIIAAIVQHITFNEFLPMVLGKNLMKRYGLLLQKDGYSTSYDPSLDASLPVSFFAAAFRFGHSLIPSSIERWSVSHQHITSSRLSEIVLRPFDIYKGGVLDQYYSGFMNQVSQAVDDAVTQELTNHLFQEPLKSFGTDLASLNMQRGRDHGVPSYNDFREFCGLQRAHRWEDLAGVFTNSTLQRYRQTYASIDDIDLWSAGISERPLAGSMVGPTFGCLMGEAFKNLKHGDRFWYENEGFPSSFTLEQLREIRRVKMSRMICDNSDKLDSAQVYVMVLPDPKINPRVPCKSSVLPRINLEHWRDPKSPSSAPLPSTPSFGPPPSSAGFGFTGSSFGNSKPFDRPAQANFEPGPAKPFERPAPASFEPSPAKPFGRPPSANIEPGPTFPKFPSFDDFPSFFPKTPFGARRSDKEDDGTFRNTDH